MKTVIEVIRLPLLDLNGNLTITTPEHQMNFKWRVVRGYIQHLFIADLIESRFHKDLCNAWDNEINKPFRLTYVVKIHFPGIFKGLWL